MREIVLDTETTGFDPDQGDRIVEIGALELVNHMPTGATFHRYINPARDMPEGAFGVHGLGADLLVPPRTVRPGEITLGDKPLFAAVGQAFLDFVGDAKLVIHNAAFDMRFLNAELARLSLPALPDRRAIDTLLIARSRFPGSPASLDALCRRFGIDNSARTLHGALLDAEILAEVYLELIGGRQPDFGLSGTATARSGATTGPAQHGPRPHPLPPRITEAERAAHAEFVAAMGDGALWGRGG
ncbi:MAG: DNA polymerase III subunit epsilon [Rubellimicrobium sp.]|nr:DNA polymerase III subunit epsilon [Rubellimicrobium sp.]